MSIEFEKYTEKSFVVRGKLLDDLEKRKVLVKQFQGSCIWNTRLKGGAGLLVPISDHNKALIEKVVGANNAETPVKEKGEDKKVEEDDEEEEEYVKRDETKKHRYKRESVKKYDSEDEDFIRKMKDANLSDDENSRRSNKKTRGRSRSRTPPSSPSTSPSRNHRRRSNTPSSSSSSSSDSSDDERIQKTIRRREKHSKDKDELHTSVDSDSEDVVSLSRRIRYISRKLSEMEKKLQKH